MLTSVDLDFSQMRQQASRSASLSTVFFETDTYRLIRKRLVKVLLAREERLREGLHEQAALAVIGGSGSGKSRMLAHAIAECEKAMTDHQDFTFGTRIASVIVPGQASVKDTCRAVLKKIGYPTEGARSED